MIENLNLSFGEGGADHEKLTANHFVLKKSLQDTRNKLKSIKERSVRLKSIKNANGVRRT